MDLYKYGVCFFFQAEDGIRDWSVTGVQTCALPIYIRHGIALKLNDDPHAGAVTFITNIGDAFDALVAQIGRASCRERV